MSDIAYVHTLPDCDIHKHQLDTPGVPAAYDAPTKGGPWANMCETCWVTHRRTPELGTGKGQRLVVGEPPARDRKAEASAAAEAGDIEGFFDAVGDGDPLDFL